MKEVDLRFSSEQWAQAGIERHRGALSRARSTGDRLALLRSLARLNGGRLDLAREGIRLGMDETDGLARHGLALDSNILRIVDERRDSRAPEGFWAAEALDASTRRIYTQLSPDAPLLRYTAHRTCRTAAQKAGIRAQLTMPPGGGLMVCMPTGSGKSLLFQLDALHGRSQEPANCVAVITPTVSLALDHERTLSAMPGLERSRALAGDLKGPDREELLNAFRRGEIPVLLLSPEIALGAARASLLEAATAPEKKPAGLQARLRTLVVDEAHIIESWGRSFRPDFQRLPALLAELRQRNPGLNVVLLSATLPPAARRVLRDSYRLAGPWQEIDAAIPRYEHDLVVQSYASSAERQAALDFVIDRAPRPMILYTTLASDAGGGQDERISAEALYRHLRERGYERVALFTGQVTNPAERRRVVDDWAADRIDIVVATSAFGMGVDKPDVRTVVHACLPEGPARWYQEIGRAARDGHQGLAVCLFTSGEGRNTRNDVKMAYSQATGSWLTRELAEARWRALLDRRSDVRWNGPSQQMRLDLDATREGLRTRADNDFNRTWNMSLLNLMQRAGVLEILSVDVEAGDGAFWDVAIREPAILDGGDDAIWDRIFELRDNEQQLARKELDEFLRLMRLPAKQCIVRAVFEMLGERSDGTVAACGRCPACRSQGLEPPHTIRSGGLERIWPASPDEDGSGALPLGTTLVIPSDPTYETGLERLVSRLAAAGLEQFVVADEHAAVVAEFLSRLPVRHGFVLGHDELRDHPHAEPALLPTAILLPYDEKTVAHLLSRCRQWMEQAQALPVVVAARADLRIGERRLDHIVSRRAPYQEEILDLLAGAQEVAG